jgi:hypothetical protein
MILDEMKIRQDKGRNLANLHFEKNQKWKQHWTLTNTNNLRSFQGRGRSKC